MVLRHRNPFRAARFAILAAALLSGAFATGQEQSYPKLRIGAFADANVSHSTISGTTDFEFGELDPFGEAHFSDKWSALAEGLVQRVERGSDNDRPENRRIELDLERAFVSY